MTHITSIIKVKQLALVLVALLFALLTLLFTTQTVMAQSNQDGSIGIDAVIPSDPPTNNPTISTPGNGTVVTSQTILVIGICQDDLLIKIFKNGVFAGSTVCVDGSYEIEIDLFSGANEITSIQYDELNQASPPSVVTTVTFDAPNPGEGIDSLTITTAFAKRGSNPGQEIAWPMAISGGVGPYAISVDWGDGEESLISVETPGDFTPRHTYKRSGVYKVVVKATDADGRVTYLQLVAVGNGPLGTEVELNESGPEVVYAGTKIIWWPAAILVPFILSTFWLGKRYEHKRIRDLIEQGKLPFKLK